MQYRLLLVDDDENNLEVTSELLRRRGYLVDVAKDDLEGIDKVRSSPYLYALVLLDYRMPQKNGAEITRSMLEINPDLFILMYSCDDTRSAIKDSLKSGAVEFLEKDANSEILFQTIHDYCQKFDQTTRVVADASDPNQNEELIASIGMIGRSEEMANVARLVQKYREVSREVLVLGESGVGKELVVRALHTGAPHKFYAVNCSAFKNAELLESELYGTERGAFTGAEKRRGILEAAGDGTVFLDEIHELSLAAQAKLLRVIQEKKIRRVGGNEEVPIRCRFIAGGKPDLAEMKDRGSFKLDLYHRLGVLEIQVPPLRERIDDIEPLVLHFSKTYAKETGTRLKRFLSKTIHYLEQNKWEGNVRELGNVVYKLLTNVSADKIEPEHLPPQFFSKSSSGHSLLLSDLINRHEREEKEYILSLLKAAQNNKSEAARRMGIRASSLHTLMKRHGLYHSDDASS